MGRPIDTDMTGTVTRERTNATHEAYSFDEWVIGQLRPRPGMSVLDIGFGGGKQIRLVKNLIVPGGRLSGIDLSEDCVASLRDFLQDVQHAEIVHGNMDDAPQIFAGKTFDLIFSVYAFYYSADMVRLLGRLASLLSDGGRVCLIGYGSHSNGELIDVINALGVKQVTAYPDFMSEGHIAAAARHFSSYRTDRLMNAIRFPSSDVVMAWLASSELFDADLEEDVRARVENVIRTKGQFEMTKESLCVTFVK